MDSKIANQLFKKLKAKTDEQDCPNLYEARFFEEDRVSVYPLNAEQVVVQVPCWRGAYNEGLGYWVMDKALQKIQQQVTTSGSSFSEAQIFSEQKGRGYCRLWYSFRVGLEWKGFCPQLSGTIAAM